jgi:hypothetical protein
MFVPGVTALHLWPTNTECQIIVGGGDGTVELVKELDTTILQEPSVLRKVKMPSLPQLLVVSKMEISIRFEVFMAMTMKNVIFWDVMPFGSCKKTFVFLCSVDQLLVMANVPSSAILVTPDDGGAKFLRNVGSYKSHMA